MMMPREHHVQCLSPAGLHTMAYTEWGDPDNPRILLCVHGLTRTGRDFDTFARALCLDYRVVCPDVVGRGRSSWLRDPQHYGIPQYVADMVSLVARLNPGELHWLGTSMGGLIGMGYAALPGNPIRKLVLNDVGPLLSGVALGRIADYVGRPVRFASFAEGVQTVRVLSAGFGEFNADEWNEIARHVLVSDGDQWKFHYDPGISVPFQQAAAQGDIDLWPLYDAITCPTLVIRGAQSDLLSSATHAQMAQRGPHAHLLEWADCGHAPMLMHDDQIQPVKKFLLEG